MRNILLPIFILCGIFLCPISAEAKTIVKDGTKFTYRVVDTKRKEIELISCNSSREDERMINPNLVIPSKLGKYRVVQIGQSAFAYCRLQTLKIDGKYLKKVGRFAFADNQDLRKVTFTNLGKTFSLGRDWFTDCPNAHIVIPKTVRELDIQVNANGGTLVIKGKHTKLKKLKKLSGGKYYLQFEEVEIPRDYTELKKLKKARWGEVNDFPEERYDSDANNYSNQTLHAVKILYPDRPRLNYERIVLKTNETCQLRVKNQKGKKVKWKSGNTRVVTVNKEGRICAKGSGIARITATCKKQVYRCIVRIYANGNPEKIQIAQHNSLITQEMLQEKDYGIRRFDEEMLTTYEKKRIYALLASLSLQAADTRVMNNKEACITFKLLWGGGEKTIVVYENDYLASSLDGFFKVEEGTYEKIKELFYVIDK